MCFRGACLPGYTKARKHHLLDQEWDSHCGNAVESAGAAEGFGFPKLYIFWVDFNALAMPKEIFVHFSKFLELKRRIKSKL